jgi:hypothetical protein
MFFKRLNGNSQLRQKKELACFVMFGAVVVLVGLTLVNATRFLAISTGVESIVQGATVQANADSDDADENLTRYKLLADALKKNNVFVPTVPKRHPVKEVSGILGNEVLIQGKWYKVGSTLGDAKIVAIEPTQAIIEWKGVEQAFIPFDATISKAPKRPQAKKAVAKGGKAERKVVKSGKGKKQKGDSSWARKMNVEELHKVRGQIAGYIEGLRAKGVTDPKKYEGAIKKMEVVDGAIWEKGN